ncbi:MAG TPA: hypothetical protein VL171_05010 [Verrucomicrobiae bacterium]|nr:hypothetical protein [Verrucomicrobiae bacterium]
MKSKFLALLALNLVVVFSANGQFSANFQTNTISAVTSNWVGNGTYVVGSNTFADVLQITNSGVLSNGTGSIGYDSVNPPSGGQVPRLRSSFPRRAGSSRLMV